MNITNDILEDMVIIVDTREKRNEHILEYFDRNNIKYKIEKLDIGDYSFILPNFNHLNLDKQILIEKKNGLDEIAGNFTKNRERFKREFEKITSEKMHLLIENTTWKKVLNGSYRSKIAPNAMLASILTWSIRYNTKVWFANSNESGLLIYSLFKYEIIEYLKKIK